MLSKFTTQLLGTPSASAVSPSSETKCRFVRVRTATTTDWMRSATGSLVRTNTGRSPPGVAANQISPRCISPIGPVLGRAPVSNLGKRLLVGAGRKLIPGLGFVLTRQPHQVAVERISQELGAVHTQLLCPSLGFGRFALADPKADHCHTAIILCMTASPAGWVHRGPVSERRSPPSWRPESTARPVRTEAVRFRSSARSPLPSPEFRTRWGVWWTRLLRWW